MILKALPIEDFRGNLKKEVYKEDWKDNNLAELKNRIVRCLGKIDLKVVQNHALAVRKRLDHIRRHGVEILFFCFFLKIDLIC